MDNDNNTMFQIACKECYKDIEEYCVISINKLNVIIFIIIKINYIFIYFRQN